MRPYSIIISAAARHGTVGDAFERLREMQTRNLTPNAVTWTTLINACGRAGQLERASAVLQKLYAPHEARATMGLLRDEAESHTLLSTWEGLRQIICPRPGPGRSLIIAGLAAACLQLASCNLCGCRSVTDEGLGAVAAACTQLTLLNLTNTSRVTDEGQRRHSLVIVNGSLYP